MLLLYFRQKTLPTLSLGRCEIDLRVKGRPKAAIAPGPPRAAFEAVRCCELNRASTAALGGRGAVVAFVRHSRRCSIQRGVGTG